MKATELMVGDYIYVKRGYDDHLTLESIKGILQDEKETYPIKITTGETISLEDIIRIRLTPEILEKNGFEMVLDEYKLPTYRIKWTCNPNIYFTVFTGVDGYWNPVGLNVIIGGIPATVDYVHELRHALRLCGISKEIEL